jgi:organic radical activating enzyme
MSIKQTLKDQLRESQFFFNLYKNSKSYSDSFERSSNRILPISYYAKKSYRKIDQLDNKYFGEIYKGKISLGEIEINKNCNLNCIMCSTQLSKRKNNVMDLVLFEKIIAEQKNRRCFTVPFHTIGEPLLNPQLEDYFKVLRRYKMETFLSTNGQLLDQKLDMLFENADVIDTLRFSIDGATKETYEKIRRPGKFDKLIHNMDLLLEMNNKKKLFKRIKIDSIVSIDVKNELAYHLKFYSKYTDMNNIKLHLMSGSILDNSYFFTNSILKKHIELTVPCGQLNGGMHVLNDGSITSCCVDFTGDLVYGNFNENTLEELINNDKIRQLRNYNLTNSFPKDHCCSSCYRINPKVVYLWETFVRLLILKYSHNWDVERMQKRFDTFFELFSDKIPAESEYLSLFN